MAGGDSSLLSDVEVPQPPHVAGPAPPATASPGPAPAPATTAVPAPAPAPAPAAAAAAAGASADSAVAADGPQSEGLSSSSHEQPAAATTRGDGSNTGVEQEREATAVQVHGPTVDKVEQHSPALATRLDPPASSADGSSAAPATAAATPTPETTATTAPCGKTVGGGGRLMLARAEAQTVFVKDNVVIHPSAAASQRIRGRLSLVRQDVSPSSLFLTWIPYSTKSSSAAASDGGGVSQQQQQQWSRYVIRSVALSEIRSIRRHTPTLGWQYIIIVLNSGLAYPPLYFYDGGVRHFLATLKQHASLIRSFDDPNVYVVNGGQDPLQRSLTSLHMQDMAPPFATLLASSASMSPRVSTAHTTTAPSVPAPAPAHAAPVEARTISSAGPSLASETPVAAGAPTAAAAAAATAAAEDGVWLTPPVAAVVGSSFPGLDALAPHVTVVPAGTTPTAAVVHGDGSSAATATATATATAAGVALPSLPAAGLRPPLREADRDPSELVHDLSLQVLERFSRVTRFARGIFTGAASAASSGSDLSLMAGPDAAERMPYRGPNSPTRPAPCLPPVPESAAAPDSAAADASRTETSGAVESAGGVRPCTPDDKEGIFDSEDGSTGWQEAEQRRESEVAASSLGSFVLLDPLLESDNPVEVKSEPQAPPLLHEEWVALLDDEGRVKDAAALRERVFHGGVQPELRREVWKFLLGYYPMDSTYAERRWLEQQKRAEYNTYKSQWETVTEAQARRFAKYRERISRVEKDVVRTDRTQLFYSGDDNPHVHMLKRILVTYSFYNFDLGYCQGMSDLLSPVLEVMEDESDAFWCFVGFMERMAPNFDRDQNGMHSQLLSVARLMVLLDPALYEYLESIDAANFFCCFRWILILFKREFAHADVMRLWEALWSCPLTQHFHLYMCAAILIRLRRNIMDDQMEFDTLLKFINDLSGRIDLHSTLRFAKLLYLRAGERGEECMPPPPPQPLDMIEGPETGLPDP